MDTPLEIAWHNVEKSEPLEARIRERVDKLHRYFDRINSCRIEVNITAKNFICGSKSECRSMKL